MMFRAMADAGLWSGVVVVALLGAIGLGAVLLGLRAWGRRAPVALALLGPAGLLGVLAVGWAMPGPSPSAPRSSIVALFAGRVQADLGLGWLVGMALAVWGVTMLVAGTVAVLAVRLRSDAEPDGYARSVAALGLGPALLGALAALAVDPGGGSWGWIVLAVALSPGFGLLYGSTRAPTDPALRASDGALRLASLVGAGSAVGGFALARWAAYLQQTFDALGAMAPPERLSGLEQALAAAVPFLVVAGGVLVLLMVAATVQTVVAWRDGATWDAPATSSLYLLLVGALVPGFPWMVYVVQSFSERFAS